MCSCNLNPCCCMCISRACVRVSLLHCSQAAQQMRQDARLASHPIQVLVPIVPNKTQWDLFFLNVTVPPFNPFLFHAT